MGIIYGKPLMSGGQKPSQLNVTKNGTWSKAGGYSPVNVNVPASAVTSGTKTIIAEGVYDVTEFKNVRVTIVEDSARLSPIDGLSYVDGLPNDWNTMKEIAKLISEASGSINANTTGSIYVNKGALAYKITPGDTINVTSQTGTYTYAVMGFNNFELTNHSNYGGTHTTAGLTFGAKNCVGKYHMNSTDTRSGGWRMCEMRTSTMSTLQNGMPSTLAQVKVPYVDYDNQSTILYSDDYMFLPAEKEVYGYAVYALKTESNALTSFAYYKNGGRDSRIKYLSGSVQPWWLRSVANTSTLGFCSIDTGGYSGTFRARIIAGAAPCFCV